MKKRKRKRVLPVFLAAMMAVSAGAGFPVYAATDSAPVVTLDKTSVASGSAQTVTMTVKLPQAVSCVGYELTCVYPDSFTITSITNDDAHVGGTLGSQYYNTANGMIKWFDAALEDSGLQKLAEVTFSIPAGTAAGTYQLGVKSTAAYSEKGKTTAYSYKDEKTVTLTVTSGSGSGGGSGDSGSGSGDSGSGGGSGSGGSGGSSGGGSGSSGGAGGGTGTDVTPNTAESTMSLIDQIGTVTKDSGSKITAAREAYDSLSDSEKSKVTNYSTLAAAESAYAALSSQTEHVFSDTQSHWAKDSISNIVGRGLFTGTSATAFDPDGNMTRGMVATVIWRTEGSPAAMGASPFNDVTADAYYATAIAWANENGILNGYSEDTFAPADNVTREQLSAILYRYTQYKGLDVSASADISKYEDAATVSSYAVDNMKWTTGTGLITGRTATQLAPRGNATRAEFAVILERWLKLYEG